MTGTTVNVKKVPPDGGYGWVIVFSTALSNIVVIPLVQAFGLIFKDTFTGLGLTATQSSFIISLNCAFGMIAGVFNGVLLKSFGYRKVAFAGAFMSSLGVILMSFASTFLHFVICYGVITSLGFAWGMSAYQLALNSYFAKKRGRAVSWALTITALGPIFLPQLITYLMREYTVQGVTLIMGAILSHSFISSILLQPIKWHMVDDIIDVEQINADQTDRKESAETNGKDLVKSRLSRSISQDKNARHGSKISLNQEQEPIIMLEMGMDTAFAGSMMSLNSLTRPRTMSMVSQRFKSNHSLAIKNEINEPKTKCEEQKSLLARMWQTLSSSLDLDLLKDPTYINILIGMSLAMFAEVNFSILTAFILADLDLNRDQSATFMSVLGIADIISRFCAPYIGEYLNKPPRPMYAVTVSMLIATRFTLLLTRHYHTLLVIALGLGTAKGIRAVYMSLVIPTYVPLEKLGSASGMQMMVNGIFYLIGGPLLGVIRDVTGSYTACIIIMNCVSMTTIIMWGVEGLIKKMRRKKAEENNEQENGLLKK